MAVRRRHQKSVRQNHVKVIVKKLAEGLKTNSHQKRMATTNRLLPVGGLRRRCVKKLFGGWILELIGKGRILTKKLAHEVCQRLRKKFSLPKLNDHDEVLRMHVLLKSARKRQIGKTKGNSKAMSSMDNLEILPLHGDAEEDWRTFAVIDVETNHYLLLRWSTMQLFGGVFNEEKYFLTCPPVSPWSLAAAHWTGACRRVSWSWACRQWALQATWWGFASILGLGIWVSV